MYCVQKRPIPLLRVIAVILIVALLFTGIMPSITANAAYFHMWEAAGTYNHGLTTSIDGIDTVVDEDGNVYYAWGYNDGNYYTPKVVKVSPTGQMTEYSTSVKHYISDGVRGLKILLRNNTLYLIVLTRYYHYVYVANGTNWTLLQSLNYMGPEKILNQYVGFAEVSESGDIYVAAKHDSYSNRCLIQRYNGSSWTSTTKDYSSVISFYGLTMAGFTVYNETPYVAFVAQKNVYCETPNGLVTTTKAETDDVKVYYQNGLPIVFTISRSGGNISDIKKYNGSSWSSIWQGTTIRNSTVHAIFANSSELYVLSNEYSDPYGVKGLITRKYADGEWDNVTAPGEIPASGIKNMRISFNSKKEAALITQFTTPYQVNFYKLVVNNAPLTKLIYDVQQLNEGDYTPASWAAIPPALEYALWANDSEEATLEQKAEALDALQAAYDGLVRRANKTDLEKYIARAAELNEGYYTANTWSAMQQRLAEAIELYNNPNARQVDVDRAATQLKGRLDALVVSINKKALKSAIQMGLKLNGNNYSQSSWDALISSLNHAVAIYNEVPGHKFTYETPVVIDHTVTQAEVDAATADLLAKTWALEGSRRDILLALIETAESLPENEYKPVSWANLMASTGRGRTVANNPASTDEEIDYVIDDITRAINGLVPLVQLPEFPDVYIIDDHNDKAYIYGVVDASILSAEVTLSSYFHIAPNAPEEERFISPDISIKNTSTMPIYVDAISMRATGDAPKVVARDKYTDQEWSRLGASETVAYIALGLTGTPSAGDFYFTGEESQSPVRIDENLLSQNTDVLGLQAKFGLSWTAAQSYKYELVFALGLRN